jgi:sulfate/thiosulfate transport system ATP-binding protein
VSIEVKSIHKSYGDFTALNDIDLEVKSGELVALLGPSGSGKTTLLRVIAGLEFAERGTIDFHGEDATRRSARERQVGFVFQHYALFRHMSVFENVAFGLRVRPRSTRPSNPDIKRRVMDLLSLVQLDNLATRYPSQLSGGQRQRVALARALAVEPKVLLLDEPFGALDAKVRIELRRWLKRLHAEIHVTTVFVTHDQEEALEVADRVVIMNHGKIEQIGTPEEVYDHPANPFVYNFLGSVNLFHGRIHEGQAHLGELTISSPEHSATSDTPVVAYVRPHDLVIERHRNGHPTIPAIVRDMIAVGPTVRLELVRRDDGGTLQAEVSRQTYNELGVVRGDEVHVSAQRMKVFVQEGADRC